jgi:hypothetical protein
MRRWFQRLVRGPRLPVHPGSAHRVRARVEEAGYDLSYPTLDMVVKQAELMVLWGRRSEQEAFEWVEEKLQHYVASTGRGLLKDRAAFAEAERVLEQHRAYQAAIKEHYRQRDTTPGALERAIEACQNQIALASDVAQAFKTLPETRGKPLGKHLGFQQLAIIREKQKEYAEAIQLSEQAKGQGWEDDWDKRIARCKQKLG